MKSIKYEANGKVYSYTPTIEDAQSWEISVTVVSFGNDLVLKTLEKDFPDKEKNTLNSNWVGVVDGMATNLRQWVEQSFLDLIENEK